MILHRRLFTVLCLPAAVLIVLLILSPPTAAHDGDPDHYKQHLRENSDRSGTGPSIKNVELPDGGSINIKQRAKEKPLLAEQSRALLREINRPQAPKAFIDGAQTELAKVLALPEFKPEAFPWYERLIEQVITLIGIVITFILDNRVRTAAVAIAASVVVILAILSIRRRIMRNRAADVVADDEGTDERLLTPREIDRRSKDAARARNYREAIRYLYLGFLADLKERRILSDREAFTNWEYVAQVNASGNKKLSERAEEVTRIFEIKWYGGRDCTRSDYEDFKRMCRL